MPPRRLLIGLGLGIGVLAAAGYLWRGAPRTPPAQAPAPATPQAQLDALLRQLHARTEQQPQDAQAWGQLARAQASLGRLPEASAAFERALALRPADAGLLADAADVLAVRQGRRLEGEPLRLLERALQADPAHPKALALWGQAAQARGDHAAAIQAWEKAAQALPAADPFGRQLRARIAKLQAASAATTAGSPPGR